MVRKRLLGQEKAARKKVFKINIQFELNQRAGQNATIVEFMISYW